MMEMRKKERRKKSSCSTRESHGVRQELLSRNGKAGTSSNCTMNTLRIK